MIFQPISEFKPHKVTDTSNVSKLYLLIISEEDSVNEKDYVLAHYYPSSKMFCLISGGVIRYSDFKSENGDIEALEFKELPKL